MGKIGSIIIIVVFVAAAYLFLLVAMPILTDFASSANATMAASSNMSNYPGTSEALIATPWILFFVPAVAGMVAVVVALKQP